VARGIIASELKRIYLVSSPHWTGGAYERGEIYLNVHDYEATPHWRTSLAVILAHEFAHSFINALVAAAAGGNPWTGDIPAHRRGTVGYDWFTRSFGGSGDAVEDVTRFTERLADALALVWGFGEAWASCLDLRDILHPHPRDSRYLDPELGKVYRVLQRRLAQE
jgi:hypothetical protein